MINEEIVKKMANLTKIELEENEIKKFTNQLNNMLGYFEEISEIDTGGIEPTIQSTDLVNSFRDDEVEDFKNNEGILSSANEKENRQIKVKKTL